MVYELSEQKRGANDAQSSVGAVEIPLSSLSDASPELPTVGIISLGELLENNSKLGFAESSVLECTTHNGSFRGSIDDFDGYSFGMLSVVDVENILGERDKIGFFIRRGLFLLVDVSDDDGSTTAVFEYALKRAQSSSATLEKFIAAFFSRLMYRDFKEAERLEFEIASLEEKLLDEVAQNGRESSGVNASLLTLKKKMLILRNYYEQLVDIGDELEENENELFDEDGLKYFRQFSSKAKRLSANIQLMRESIVQLREAYDASIDISLNNVMKLFTVVTTIFLPLSLIAGWYGMNFTGMGELTWEFGYPFVIALSVVCVIVCLIIFKKKKLL